MNYEEKIIPEITEENMRKLVWGWKMPLVQPNGKRVWRKLLP